MKERGGKWLFVLSSHFQNISNPNTLVTKSNTAHRDFTRDVLAEKPCTAYQIIFYQSRYVAHQQSKNSYLIKKQERVIELQEELLAAKDVHLQHIQEKSLILSEILLNY